MSISVISIKVSLDLAIIFSLIVNSSYRKGGKYVSETFLVKILKLITNQLSRLNSTIIVISN